jgi:baseplate J-like protein
MATFTLEELIEPLTTEELQASFYTALATTGVTTTTWKPGAVVRTIIAIVCIVLSALSSLVANLARSGFVTLARGLWLKLHAFYTYNVVAQEATFAAGIVYVTNPTGGVYDYDPDELEFKSSITQKTYRNTAVVHIGAVTTDTPVAIQAVEAGAASSALIGEVDTIATAMAVGATCHNTAVLVGLDEEGEELLKVRCAEKLGSFSPNGPADAYAVAARGAVRSNGVAIGVNRIRTVPTPFCGIDVYVAVPAGAVTGTVGDLNSDLGLIDEAIQTQAVPLTVTARVYTAVEKVIDVAATVWVYNTTGLTEVQIKAAITAELESYFADPLTAPIGGNIVPGASGFIYAEDLSAAILRAKASGASIRAFRAIVTPSASIPIDAAEVPVLGAVTLTIVRVAPTSGVV